MGNNAGSETEKMKEFLSGLINMEKQFSKLSSNLGVNLTDSFEKIVKEAMVEFEKRTKLNKKAATMSLMKDGSVKIVFDNPEDGAKFVKGDK